MLTTSHIQRVAIACAVGGALILPATALPAQDLRSDARTSSLAGTTSPKQDLRSPDARDAAINAPGPTAAHSATRPEARTLPGPPTWPQNPRPITPAVSVEPTADGGGVDWAPIGAGIIGGLLAVGGIAALAGRRRSQRLRVAA